MAATLIYSGGAWIASRQGLAMHHDGCPLRDHPDAARLRHMVAVRGALAILDGPPALLDETSAAEVVRSTPSDRPVRVIDLMDARCTCVQSAIICAAGVLPVVIWFPGNEAAEIDPAEHLLDGVLLSFDADFILHRLLYGHHPRLGDVLQAAGSPAAVAARHVAALGGSLDVRRERIRNTILKDTSRAFALLRIEFNARRLQLWNDDLGDSADLSITVARVRSTGVTWLVHEARHPTNPLVELEITDCDDLTGAS